MINPSSSRFALNIPLLGRPKVPLGSALGKETDKGSLFDLPSIVSTNPVRPSFETILYLLPLNSITVPNSAPIAYLD